MTMSKQLLLLVLPLLNACAGMQSGMQTMICPAPPSVPLARVEDHRSQPQDLLVKNDTDRSVTLLAGPARLAAAVLKPGEKLSLTFSVATLFDLEPASDGTWGRKRDTTAQNVLIPTAGATQSWLTQERDDIVMRFDAGDGQIWDYHFFFGPCWERRSGAARSEIQLNIQGPPRAGIAQEICPGSQHS